MAQFSRVIDKVRNSEYRKASEENKAVFKGAKYLLLKNRKNIRLKTQREQLKQLLEFNEVINITMILKDSSNTSDRTAQGPGPAKPLSTGGIW